MASLDAAVMKGSAPKEEMQLMLQPFNQLENRLGSAPLCINILGHLCLISTQKDFSLKETGSGSG